jgi:hypothetical protein
MKGCYVFINWDTKDVVSTYSHPYDYVSCGVLIPQGRRAKQLIKEGYTYVGSYTGMKATLIRKDTKE